MAAKGKRQDEFANVVAVSVTESAASTLTFTEFLTGVSLGHGIGMLIDHIEYYIGPLHALQLTAASDEFHMALVTTNDVGDIKTNALTDRRILHSSHVYVQVSGTPGSAALIGTPMVYQFFPPMIIASPRLFFGAAAVGFGTPTTAIMRMFFRYIELTPQEYLELAEAFVLAG